MKTYSFVLVLVLVAGLEAAHLKLEKKSAAAKIARILSHVPSGQQKQFIRYHLQKGHELTEKEEKDKYPEFDYDISDSDSMLIYDYFSEQKSVGDEDVIKTAQNIICWGDKCIDFSDPGVHP